MLRIASCEDVGRDALLLRQMVEQYLEDYNCQGEIDVFESGEALLEAYHPGKYHIAFLDIYLSEMNGIQVARKLREQDDALSIIFLTVSNEFAMESYSVHSAYYITKPLEYRKLSEAMARCSSKLLEHSRHIEVFSGRIPTKLPLKDILYMEATYRQRVIFTVDSEVKTGMTLDTLEELTADASFVRCHRGFIVNLRHISDLGDNEVVMVNGAQVPLGRSYMGAFKQHHKDYVRSKTRIRR